MVPPSPTAAVGPSFAPLLAELSTTAVSVAAAAVAVAAVGATVAWLAGAGGIPDPIPFLLIATAIAQGACTRLSRRSAIVGGQVSAAVWTVANVFLTLTSPPSIAHVVGPLGLMVVALIGTISAPPGVWVWGPVAVAAWWFGLAVGGVASADVGPVAAFPAVIFVGTTLLIARITDQLHRSEASRRDALRLVEARSEEADRANRAKSAFLASMSHELRTPLNAIIGYSELLGEQAEDEESRTDAARITRAGRHLLALVDDLLDMAKIEAGRLRLDVRPFDPRAVLDELRPVAESLARARGNRLVWDVEPSVPACLVGDELRVRQVLLNLVGNALKFTDAGTVRLWARGDGSGLRVWIVDDGPGLDPEARARLFQPFGQGRARQGGTGLGLAISRELVERMGGTIALLSPPGPGATFEVWWPGQSTAAPTPSA